VAFPGTYNFAYYRGDTLEFRAFPKDSSGSSFSLDGYSAAFTISTERGDAGAESQIECFALPIVAPDVSSILCVIRPEDGLALVAGQTYVYDVEISKDDDPYNRIYTIITGSITVTDHITGAGEEIEPEEPEEPEEES
jgi:hypothetical protein